MPWNHEHKSKSRDKILEAAACLFTHQGFDAVSIDDVMCKAGLTRGAFYAHFSSKSELYNEAVLCGARLAGERVRRNEQELEVVVRRYLSIGAGVSDQIFNVNMSTGARDSDLEENAEYCPLAFLVTDICHRDDDIKSTYTKILSGYQSLLKEFNLNEAQAIQASILLIGGLALSRAVNDDAARDKILNSSYSAVMSLAKPENS